MTIASIGRIRTAAERDYSFVLENSHILDHVTQNLLAHETGNENGIEVASQWREMSEERKDTWRAKALAKLREDLHIPEHA